MAGEERVRLITWLFTASESLFYLVGFFISVGGILMFVGHVVHHYVTRPRTPNPLYVDNRRVDVHIENLNLSIEMSRDEVIELIERRGGKELPPGD
jgi:hypothetical protein